MGFAGSQYHQGPGPLYINDPLKPFLPPTVYSNTEQSYTNTCPDGTTGDPITVTVPAGTFTSTISQEFVDAEALASAISQANALRALHPCLTQIPNVLWAWGMNNEGSLGVGNTQEQDTPIIIGYSALDWVKVAGGGNFSLGIKTDGSLWSWGANYEGQLGLGTQSIFPSTSENKLYPTRIGTENNWSDISCGEQTAAAIKSDGTLWTWGFNGSGQLGQGDTTDRLSPTKVGSGTNWKSVATATDNILAIKSDGTLWGCGDNSSGQLGNGTTTEIHTFAQSGTDTDWASISVQHSGISAAACARGIKTDGTLWTWGSNSRGQLGIGSAGGSVHSPGKIGTDTHWLATSGGDQFSIALKTDGTLWSTGWNFVGQLGQGNTTQLTSFTQIGSATDWASIECGEYFSTARKVSGELMGWGQNTIGQLGQGTPSGAVLSPIQMGSDDKWSAVATGFSDTFGLRTDLTDPAPPTGNNGVASGGIYTTSVGNSIHRFDSNGTFTVYVDTVMDYLVVGGGGGGGGIGGGGAGQFQKLTGITILAGTYAVSVSQRALRAFGGESRGENGGIAAFHSTTSLGGGGGGAISDTIGTGAAGASGGGGGYLFSGPGTGQNGGAASAGNVGGNGFTNSVANGAGGGGGGASGGGVNAASNTGGAGGIGTSDSITGAAVFYAAGGGGAGPTTGGAGGSSVGGHGSSTTTPATPGQNAGSGGGGGLGNFWPVGTEQGDGAYGTVIITYPTPP